MLVFLGELKMSLQMHKLTLQHFAFAQHHLKYYK